MKNFLNELQALPEPTKRKVLVAVTIVLMAVVIYFWLIYFNTLLAGVSQPAPANPVAASGGDIGLWQRLQNGFVFIGSQFQKMAQGLSSILAAPRQYIVNPRGN